MNINFKSFSKTHWWLMLVLFLMLVIPTVIFCGVFKGNLYDASAWASLTAGVFTYLGAAFLGVLTYYNAWSQNKQQEFVEQLRIDVNVAADMSEMYFVPFTEDALPEDLQSEKEYFEKQTSNDRIEMNYLEFDIKNHNPFISVSASVIGMYYINDENVVTKISRFKVKSTQDPQVFIDYKQQVNCYIGCSSKLLRNDYYINHQYSNWFVVLKLITSKYKTRYLILDYVLGRTLGANKIYLTEKQYQRRLQKSNSPISLNAYNAQFFKKFQ